MQKLQKWMIYVLIAVCFCMLQLSAVYAENNETRTIRVAFPAEEGMSYFHEDGTPDGYSYVYLQKIAEYTGWKIECVPYDSGDFNADVTKSLDDLLA